MIRRPPRSTPKPSSAASDVYKRQSIGDRQIRRLARLSWPPLDTLGSRGCVWGDRVAPRCGWVGYFSSGRRGPTSVVTFHKPVLLPLGRGASRRGRVVVEYRRLCVHEHSGRGVQKHTTYVFIYMTRFGLVWRHDRPGRRCNLSLRKLPRQINQLARPINSEAPPSALTRRGRCQSLREVFA